MEGERAVEQILKNGFLEINKIFIKQSCKAQVPALSNRADSNQYTVSGIEDQVFDEIADTDNPQGILAVCKMPDEPEIRELTEKSGILIATDAIQDPGNMGTIIRTAAWFDVRGLLSGKGSVDIYHPKVVRSTAGATGSLPVLNGDLPKLLAEFEQAGWSVMLLDGGTGSVNLSNYQKSAKTILVVGNEANGINAELMQSGRTQLRIPDKGNKTGVESLNAAVALSIALYSVSRG